MKTKTNVKAGNNFFNTNVRLNLKLLNKTNFNNKFETIVKHQMCDLFTVKVNIPIIY